MPAAQVDLPAETIAQFCRDWKINRLEIFGSVLRDDFRPDSDVDFLVTFAPEARWSLFDFVHIQEALSQILHRPVDLVERSVVERSRNPFRKKSILESAQLLYAKS